MNNYYRANRDRILGLSAQLHHYAKGKGKTATLADLSALDEMLRTNDAFVFVCGEFKQGKSTLISALLEQKRLCPIDVDIATSVVSIIRYSEKERIVRHFGDLGGGKSEEIKLADIPKYCVGDSEAIDKTYLLEIEVPNPRLKSGMVLMDTPGVGGLDLRHGLLTDYYAPKADIILYVFDTIKPLSETDLAFIKNRLVSRSKHLLFVMTKADLVEDPSVKLEDARQKIASALNWSPSDVRIVPVSSTLKLKYVAEKHPDDLAESNFPALESELPQAIADREKELQGDALVAMENAVTAFKAPLLVRLSVP